MDFETSRQAWILLSRHFPDALAATLMPNHLHLIIPHQSPEGTLCKLAGLMGVISKKQRIPRLWQPIAEPVAIHDRLNLKRQIRYVALNPCRAQLCSDPLMWIWSTYRDVMGAAAVPWGNAKRLAIATGESEIGFRIRFHAYVSGDPSVAVAGTPFPKSAPARTLAQEGIREILEAAAAALRAPVSDVQKTSELRKLFVTFSHRQAWRQTHVLAQICKANPRTIQYIVQNSRIALDSKNIQQALSAAALCLGDGRLRNGVCSAN